MKSAFAKRLLTLFLALGGVGSVHAASAEPLRVQHLRVEMLDRPEGIDTARPLLSWQVTSQRRAEIQTAYRIVLAKSPEALNQSGDALWDSGKVVSGRTLVPYAGREILSGERCYWKVMSWNRSDEPSLWSEVSEWSTGLLHLGDWTGSWIGADVDEDARTVHSGYQAEPSHSDTAQSVTIDLEKVLPLQTVVLHPATRIVGKHMPGYGFPRRLIVETSADGEYFQAGPVYEEKNPDAPGYRSVPLDLPNVRARLVRIRAVQLWRMPADDDIHTDVPYRFALGEVQVLSGGKNVALHAPVSATTSTEQDGWGLRYLVDGEAVYDPAKGHAGDAEILLGKSIAIARPVRRATAYISGLGYAILEIDGVKVGDRELDPGHTDYTRRVLYSTYDVTKLLQRGRNLIGIRLGNGWFHLPSMDLFGNERAPWTAPPQALLNLRVEYVDGTEEAIGTDGSWQWSTGPVTYNSVRGGETIDWSRPTGNWKNFGDRRYWRPVRMVSAPAGQMHGQEEQPVRVLETVKSVRITEPVPHVYVFDFGVNMAGTVRFKAAGQKGQKVTLQFNERLKPDGTLDALHEALFHTYGRFQTGELILSGGPEDVFEPRYSYHGFQYVQVTGLDKPPNMDDMEARILDTDAAVIGSFRSSNDKFNKLQAAIIRTERNYNIGYPNDPLREKTGWVQDVQNDFDVSMLNMDLGPVYRRWFHDIMDAQDGDGHEPCIAPTTGWCRASPQGAPGIMSDVWWGGSLVYLPWLWYQRFGDDSLIREGYPAAKRYLDYLSSTAHNDLLDWGLGDWGDSPGGGLPVHSARAETVSAGYFYVASLLAKEAQVLGKEDDAARYTAIAERIRQAFNRSYFDAGRGTYANPSQTSQVLPLYTGLVPTEYVDTTSAALVQSVHAADDHLGTGFVGLFPLLKVLGQLGQEELAFKIANQDDVPGWWSMIKDGGTTVTEYWDSHTGTRNLINLAGPLGVWFYETVAGIRLDPSHPGYEHINLKPQPIGDLTYAEAQTETIRGEVKGSWKLAEGKLFVSVTIPANTTATLALPVAANAAVQEAEGDGTGVTPSTGAHSYASWTRELGSGTYHFNVPFHR